MKFSDFVHELGGRLGIEIDGSLDATGLEIDGVTVVLQLADSFMQV